VRLRAWTVHVGPLVIAAALVPTLVGMLVLAAPADPAVRNLGGGTGAVSSPAASSAAPTNSPKVEWPPSHPPVLPCTPLRARPVQPRAVPRISVEGVMSERGEHVGRHVQLRARQGAEVSVTLPADSFVGQPSGDWLVYGAAGRHGSEVRAIDLETGCDVRLARVDGVPRGAVLDAAGARLYVHAVEARGRRDLGVTRVDLASGVIAPALPRFDPADDFGPVFATSLRWSIDGAVLAVQSCGADACHTRLLDTTSGSVAVYDTPHGGLVGVTADDLIAFASGHERPAALLAIPRSGGEPRVIVADAYAAELVGTPDAPLLRVETPAGWEDVAP
jgi:hypothetical protein